MRKFDSSFFIRIVSIVNRVRAYLRILSLERICASTRRFGGDFGEREDLGSRASGWSRSRTEGEGGRCIYLPML
jgi:hypothetical protein